jgi:hypothetical protein
MKFLVLATTAFLAISLSAHAAVRTAPPTVTLPADSPATSTEAVETATAKAPSATLLAAPAKKPAVKCHC